MPTNNEMTATGVRRRGVMGGLGVVAVIAAAVAATSSPAMAAVTDIDIVNFALNFEYLGAELYLHALTGTGFGNADITGTGTLGAVSAGGPVPFKNAAIQSYVQRLAVNKLGHVRFIRAVLGGAAIARPAINLSTSWTTLALATGLIVPGQTFSPVTDDISLLLGAYVVEDVCVTALAGAARLLTNPNNVEAAAGLLGTEAYQAGAIRTLLSDLGAGVATDAVSNLRSKPSGAPDDIGTLIAGNAYNFVPTDVNGLAFRRTTTQVLNIAYGGGAAAGYGFFPKRVNGTIT